jgi:hypothetical protein
MRRSAWRILRTSLRKASLLFTPARLSLTATRTREWILARRWSRALLKVAFFYICIRLITWMLVHVFRWGIMGIPALEGSASSDLCLNDLHYAIRDRDNSGQPLSGRLLLVNTGDLPADDFREGLAELLQVLRRHRPAAIAVDHTFSADTSLPGTQALASAIGAIPGIILARHDGDSASTRSFGGDVAWADVGFPLQSYSIRRYRDGGGSFAAAVARRLGYEASEGSGDGTFIIHYVAHDSYPVANMLMDTIDIDAFGFLGGPSALPMLTAGELLLAEAWDPGRLGRFLEGKAVLIGHLGSTSLRDIRNDVEDRHPVPCDSNLVHRQRTMSGLQIHANAIENLLNPEVRFRDLDSEGWFVAFEEALLILYLIFLIFAKWGKLLNILMMLLLSLPVLFVVLYLMNLSVYAEMGATLLQLLIFEEMVEILDPMYHRVRGWLVPSERTSG